MRVRVRQLGTDRPDARRLGHRPALEDQHDRYRRNAGTLRFRVFQQRFTGPVFLDFIRRLTRQPDGKKIVLIIDRHPPHRARLVRDRVAGHPDLIELHYLSSYSPELNPAEMLRNDVKANASPSAVADVTT